MTDIKLVYVGFYAALYILFIAIIDSTFIATGQNISSANSSESLDTEFSSLTDKNATLKVNITSIITPWSTTNEIGK